MSILKFCKTRISYDIQKTGGSTIRAAAGFL